MPLHSESFATDERIEFCRALKSARERKGVSLDDIAEATKIPASLFAALECCDLRRWPNGLFRRSFFRDYVRMLDLPVGELCAEFARLFTDEEATAHPKPAGPVVAVTRAAEPPSGLRLSLDTTWHGPRTRLLLRAVAATFDACIISFASAAAALLTSFEWPSTTAVTAVLYYSAATTIFGESPAMWAWANRQSVVDLLHRASAFDFSWRPHLNALRRLLPREPELREPEPASETGRREWFSDARRVGPAPDRRARFKVSR